MTTSSTTLDPSATALSPEASPRLPLPLQLAANYGLHQGTITLADLPAEPAADADLPAWWADVHRLLNQRGVLGAYRAEELEGVRAASCPPWCPGDHPPVIARLDDVEHALTVDNVYLDGDPVAVVTVAVTAWEDGTGELTAPSITIDGRLPDRWSADGAQNLAAALAAAAAKLRAVTR